MKNWLKQLRERLEFGYKNYRASQLGVQAENRRRRRNQTALFVAAALFTLAALGVALALIFGNAEEPAAPTPPVASPSPSIVPSPSPTIAPTQAPTPTPTVVPTPTPTPTPRPTATPTIRPTASPTQRPTPTPVVTPSPSPTPTPFWPIVTPPQETPFWPFPFDSDTGGQP